MYLTDTRAWSPFGELRSLQREMNRLFDGYDGGMSTSCFPPLNVWTDGDRVLVTAEIPGVDPEQLDISVTNNQLTIKGERREEKPAEDALCHRAERVVGSFLRTVRLPFVVESDQTTAGYENGVLRVSMPRHEATKPRRIEIKTS